MRYLVTFLIAAILAGSCKNNDKSGAAVAPKLVTDSTTIQWLDSTKDFGKIQEGQQLAVSFRFKNTGDKPLVIERVQPSCGCTVAEQSKEPVAPGNEGEIKATFNSQGHNGINHKTLFVYANTKNSPNYSLQFVVEVQKQ
jgi:Protein of unknown function (DUF1573)